MVFASRTGTTLKSRYSNQSCAGQATLNVADLAKTCKKVVLRERSSNESHHKSERRMATRRRSETTRKGGSAVQNMGLRVRGARYEIGVKACPTCIIDFDTVSGVQPWRSTDPEAQLGCDRC
jgi:hypothetical protein